MTTIESISQLNKIFKRKKWSDIDIDEFVFDNFCQLLYNVKEVERNLIIELIERYHWVSIGKYPERILNTLEKIESAKIENLKTIYLFPIIKQEDEGRVKSGQFLMYQIKAFKRHLQKYVHTTFKYVTKFEDFTESTFTMNSDEAIFLIDDYIGSGETLNACLEVIKTNTSITNSKINIITLAIQNKTANKIEKQGISIYSDYVSKRGITDYSHPSILKDNVEIMIELEKMIPGGSHFSFGYNGTEALITLARTPDNTFPIFWMQYRIGKVKFDAPFSRDETIDL